MVYVKFPKDLEKRELRAHRIGESEIKKGDKSKELSDKYLGIGKDCEERGFFDKAYANYKDALRYVPRGGEEEIEKELISLGENKKETIKLFRGMRVHGLEKTFVFAAFAIVSFVIALFFISSSLTGYAIGGLSYQDSRWIGTVLFILGLVCAFFYFKNKK